MSAITRRSFLATAAAGLAAGTLARSRAAGAAEGQTSDQMLDELMRENQDNGLGSGFDNSSRNVRLPKKSSCSHHLRQRLSDFSRQNVVSEAALEMNQQSTHGAFAMLSHLKMPRGNIIKIAGQAARLPARQFE